MVERRDGPSWLRDDDDDDDPLMSGMDKATNFKFCTLIHRIDRNKSPLKL